MKAISSGLKVLYCQRNRWAGGFVEEEGWKEGRQGHCTQVGGRGREERQSVPVEAMGFQGTLGSSGCHPKSPLLPPASVQAQRDIIRTNSAKTKPRFRVCCLDEANVLTLRCEGVWSRAGPARRSPGPDR